MNQLQLHRFPRRKHQLRAIAVLHELMAEYKGYPLVQNSLRDHLVYAMHGRDAKRLSEGVFDQWREDAKRYAEFEHNRHCNRHRPLEVR